MSRRIRLSWIRLQASIMTRAKGLPVERGEMLQEEPMIPTWTSCSIDGPLPSHCLRCQRGHAGNAGRRIRPLLCDQHTNPRRRPRFRVGPSVVPPPRPLFVPRINRVSMIASMASSAASWCGYRAMNPHPRAVSVVSWCTHRDRTIAESLRICPRKGTPEEVPE